MGERTENLGRHVELRQKRQKVASNARALRDALRRALPPECEAEELEADTIVDLATNLASALFELAGIDKKLGILQQSLGL